MTWGEGLATATATSIEIDDGDERPLEGVGRGDGQVTTWSERRETGADRVVDDKPRTPDR